MQYSNKHVGMILSVVVLLALSISVQAASKKDPSREIIRRAQIQLQQLQNEKAALQQEKTVLSQELDALKQQSDALAATAASANRSKAALEKEVEKLRQEQVARTEEIAGLKKYLVNSQSAERETRSSLQQETNQKQRLEQNLSARDKALEVCETKNKTLYQYHVELINRAQNRGTLDVLLEAEPVLGFKRVQIENLLEEYRDKLDEQKINTTTFSEAPSK